MDDNKQTVKKTFRPVLSVSSKDALSIERLTTKDIEDILHDLLSVAVLVSEKSDTPPNLNKALFTLIASSHPELLGLKPLSLQGAVTTTDSKTDLSTQTEPDTENSVTTNDSEVQALTNKTENDEKQALEEHEESSMSDSIVSEEIKQSSILELSSLFNMPK